MKDPVLSANHVAKVFTPRDRPPTVALADVSLDVAEGEFLVLLGASGCGKTTLLRLFAGLERPSRGEVRVFGRTVTEPTPQAAVVFQSAVLLPWRTILENVMLPLEIQKRKASRPRERALELLEATGLGQFANHYPRELSGGMRQRAAICRALILDSPILLMDEPFGALDAITRSMMNRDLYETWQRMGKTVVFVTHDITEAVRLGTRVVLMTPQPGRIARVHELTLDGTTYEERIKSPQYLEYLRELEGQVEETTRSQVPTRESAVAASDPVGLP